VKRCGVGERYSSVYCDNSGKKGLHEDIEHEERADGQISEICTAHTKLANS
jgi:hypothetical protein